MKVGDKVIVIGTNSICRICGVNGNYVWLKNNSSSWASCYILTEDSRSTCNLFYDYFILLSDFRKLKLEKLKIMMVL